MKQLLSSSLKSRSINSLLLSSSYPSTSTSTSTSIIRFQSSWDSSEDSFSKSTNRYGRTVNSNSYSNNNNNNNNNEYDNNGDRDSPPHQRRDGTTRPVIKIKKRFIKQVPPLFNPPPTEIELEKRVQMRIKRAERLERKDLTAQLTETKTYMGGFTQPRHLAFLNTLDPTRKEKDSYAVRVGATRVRPSPEAYEPHTVYLAVTRYPIKWPPGRATRRECFSGFCKEEDIEKKFIELNYGCEKLIMEKGKVVEPPTQEVDEEGKPIWTCHGSSKEYLDLAVWPDGPDARSIANRPYYSIRKATMKALKLEQDAIAAGEPLVGEPYVAPPLPSLLPAVQNWTRPSPPFLDHRLVVPLLSVTLPTRPLAATLARLCNAHPRGLPFFASVPNTDRKDGSGFFRRLLRMRADRIRELTGNIVEKLDGVGGGLFGVRFTSEDKGRGVEGENLSEEVNRPEGGWAEIRFLNLDSDIWDGIEKEVFIDSWTNFDGVSVGPQRDETAKAIGTVGEGEGEGGEAEIVKGNQKESKKFSDYITDSLTTPKEEQRVSL